MIGEFMSAFEAQSAALTAFVVAHAAWIAPMAFALAFVKSLPVMPILIPGTATMLAVGSLIGASGISFTPVWLAVSLGAGLGDWVSFWLGQRYGPRLMTTRFAEKRRKLFSLGESFFRRWGALSIVLCRFVGPLRATVPMIAGVLGMRNLTFQIANWFSAFLWAAVLLLPGMLAFKGLVLK